MVRKVLIALLLIPSLSFAADFTAQVERNNVSVGQNFNLTLKLSDTSAKESPSLSVLEKNFTILRQGKSSSTSIINGDYSSSTSWNLILTPKKEGNITIPSVSIKTSDGTLSTKAISMNIASASSLPQSDKDISVSANISKKNPYKNEPVIFNVKMVSYRSMSNVSLDELKVEDAIVEQQGEATVSDDVANGRAVKLIEISYLITPLKSGTLQIPPLVIKGDAIVNKKSRLNDPFDSFGSFGGVDMFSIQSLEPFAVSTKQLQLSIKAPESSVTPWLPASSIKISDVMNEEQELKSGEPFSRSITIVAEGIAESQLPKLNLDRVAGKGFKAYADKPETGEDIKNGKIVSWITQSYTLIPQKSGKLLLPEISINWWDINQNKANTTTLEAKTLSVKQGVSPSPQPSKTTEPVIENETTSSQPQQYADINIGSARQDNHILYTIIATLGIIILLLLIIILQLKRKVDSSFNNESDLQKSSTPTHQKPQAKVDTSSINTPEELRNYIQNYAAQRWGLNNNASLEQIFSTLVNKCPSLNKEDIKHTSNELSGALYANKEIDFNSVKSRCLSILQQAQKTHKELKTRKETLPELNPS
jgi:hypothetical protein